MVFGMLRKYKALLLPYTPHNFLALRCAVKENLYFLLQLNRLYPAVIFTNQFNKLVHGSLGWH